MKLSKLLSSRSFRLAAGAFIIFAGILLYLPQAGVIRSLPLISVCAFFAAFFIPDFKTASGLCFVMSFILHCGMGRSVSESFLLSAAAVLFTIFGIYAFKTVKKLRLPSKNKSVLAIQAALAAIVWICAYCFVCGNIFSALSASSNNTAYISEHYGDSAKKLYTYYSPSERAYKTCVAFTDGNITIGNDKEYCIARRSGELYRDGIRDYFEDKLLIDYENALSNLLSNKADNFEVLGSDIDFATGETVKQNASDGEYYERTDYAVAIYALGLDKDYFESVCLEFAQFLSETKNFSFKSVTVVGADASSVKYTLTITPENVGALPEASQFSSRSLRTFGISEKDILSYWQNS